MTTALPTISAHFHTSAGYIWVGAAYILLEGAATPVWGKVSDIWGRKPVLLMAIAVFFIGSALSAAAVSMAMLIAGRAVQGLGGGGLVNLSLVVIADLFSMRCVRLFAAFVYYGMEAYHLKGPVEVWWLSGHDLGYCLLCRAFNWRGTLGENKLALVLLH